MQLSDLLTGLVTGTLTVPIVSWLLTQIEAYEGQLDNNFKRWLALVLAFGLGLIGFFGSIWLGYLPAPAGLESWFNALWPVLAAAYTASQLIFSGVRLFRRR